jgi:glycosyltransferase involved in cell wall biosynthesis
MVVWNHFVTDARVTKEAKTLIEAGKNVTVIAINEPGKTLENEIKNGITIHRVSRKPFGIDKLRSTYLKIESYLKNKEQNSKNINKYYFLLNRKINKLGFIIVKRLLSFQGKMTIKYLINYRFLNAARKENAGVYQAHDLNTLIPVFLVSRMKGTRIVYDAHEVSTDRAGWKNKTLWEFVEKKLMRKVDVTITTNNTRAEYFEEKYNIPKPIIIKNMPEYQRVKRTKLIHSKLKLNEEEKIILYQGGLQRERGLENIIQTSRYIDTGKVVFIGNGHLKSTLKEMVNELSLNDKVYFIDTVPMEELLNYTASADIGLQVLLNTCFNHYSACSNKLFEYLMAGIPVVCSNLPEMKKVVEDSNSGIVINQNSYLEIANAVNELLSNEKKLTQMKKNALCYSENCHWNINKGLLIKNFHFS